jgi:alpha-ketoglutarate-dependent taurine dioxygenase
LGTEIVGLQLKDLTDQQKDELGLLIAERSVVFFRDQDISPQEQLKLGEWYGEIEVHVCKPLIQPPSLADMHCSRKCHPSLAWQA